MNPYASREEETVENLSEPRLPVNWWKWGCVSVVVVVLLLILFSVGAIYWVGQEFAGRREQGVKDMAKTLAGAAEQFLADYERLPFGTVAGTAAPQTDRDTDTSPVSGFIAILTGRETGNSSLNTNGIDYLDGFRQARENSKKTGEWIGGLVLEENQTAVIDEWGNPFRVRLDTNGDGRIVNPNPDEAEAGRGEIPERVIIWSAGPDGDFDTWSDNPRSWE